ncbi:MAG: metallophosphoesterase [Spirochaetota bacterium]
MGRVIAFKLVVAVITLTLLAFQYVIWKKLVSRFEAGKSMGRLRIFYWSFVGAGQAVMWFAVFYPGRGLATTLPEWYQPLHGMLLAINYSHFVWLLPLGIFWLMGILFRRLQRARPEQPAAETGISRSDFLRRAMGTAAFGVNLLPAATSVTAISGIFLGSREITIMPKEIHLKGLHDDLKGLRLVQISDIHIGNLIGERYLNFTLGLIREARPDYVLVTGDIIDNNNVFLPVAANYFALIEAMLRRPGDTAGSSRLLGVLGNHDLIDNGLVAGQGLSRAGLRILRNELQTVRRGRGKLQIGGLDYPPLGRGRTEMMKLYFSEVKEKRSAEAPLLLLNHNPADFEFLKTQQVDLVLSGHTHGGQINFSRSQNTLLNGAHWVYKYYVDHYAEQGSQLYVNRGLGHWFPLRVNCPPEITVITLV